MMGRRSRRFRRPTALERVHHEIRELGLIGVNELRAALECVVEIVDTVFGPPKTGGKFVGREDFQRTLQMDNYSCAPCCGLAVLRHLGRTANLASVERSTGATRPSPVE